MKGKETREAVVRNLHPFHDYTVSFLAFIIWDPVHMYNFITNRWENVKHPNTFDVRQPKTQKHVIEKLKQWMKENPDTDVVRFTTFFHQFTQAFNEYAREKSVDWFGYSASPYILEQFEQAAGYPFRPHHHQPGPFREFKDFQRFQQREVAKLMEVFVDICHENGKEAIMFLGDY